MFLSELHQLLPAKLFSKKLGETISQLLSDAEELGPEIGEVEITGKNPTAFGFVAMGGEVEDGARNPEVKAYMRKVSALVVKAFRDAKIQQPHIKTTYSTHPSGDSEILVACTWSWTEPAPELNGEVLKSAIDERFEPEVKV